MEVNKIYQGNCLDILKTFEDECIDCCITSPPYYGLRDYGTGDAQVGLEDNPEEYIANLVAIFHEVQRVLKDEGTLWLNIGDTYNGNKTGNTETVKHPKVVTESGFQKTKWDGAKSKDLIGIPWMLAFALRADGWYLRQDIIWAKPNPMPESVKDRCTKSHEYIFLLSKNPTYYFDYTAILEVAVTGETVRDKNEEGYQADYAGGDRFSKGAHVYGKDGMRNKRDVWTVLPSRYKGAHFATFPEELISPMVLAGCPTGGVVLDPFMGSGTTGVVAKKNHRNYVGCELNSSYIDIAINRIGNTQTRLF